MFFDFEGKSGERIDVTLATGGAAGGATVEVAGPYPNPEQPSGVCAGFDTVYPPEVDLAARGGRPADDREHPWRPLALERDAAATGADREVARILATETQRPAAATTPPRIADAASVLVADGRVATLRTAPGIGAYLVIDFGREVFGRPMIQITGAKGGVLDLGYSEKLDGKRVNPTRGDVRYADRIRLRDGAQTFETFEKRAFRYLKLSARDLAGPLYVDFVGLREEAYPLADYSEFECSDPLLNQIFAVSKYTLRLCMEDAYIDCPWRERGQWWGDARVEALVNYVVFGDTALVRKGLRQIGQSQRPDGSLLALYPASSIAKDFMIPDYVAIWISSIWDYFVFTGDVAPLRELFPRIEKTLAWFASLEGPEGLLRDVKGWVFIDWADVDKRGECGPLNAFYLAALDDASRIAEAVGRADRASEWKAQATRVREAYGKRLWSPDAKRFVDCRVGDELSTHASLHANALPVILGIGSEEQRRSATEFLCAAVEKDPTGGASPYFDT
ncbi:MAG: family 78 glycoside hydrolase catalytic domain [Planctomycetes bacterium]|nr:family 78 glycoside hydrolase catalytic domain [Planctomycetota bacterium]